MQPRETIALSSCIVTALLLTQTRASILALIIASFYLLGRRYWKWLIPAILIAILAIGFISTTRQIEDLSKRQQMTSDRIYLWQIAQRGIQQRPWLGWGFDGFGIAYPHVWNPHITEHGQIVHLGQFGFAYRDQNHQLRAGTLYSNKSHNLILDILLSGGIWGLLAYTMLAGFCLRAVMRSHWQGLEAVAIVYVVFTLAWFECAQYSHLVWWALSCWGSQPQKPVCEIPNKDSQEILSNSHLQESSSNAEKAAHSSKPGLSA